MAALNQIAGGSKHAAQGCANPEHGKEIAKAQAGVQP